MSFLGSDRILTERGKLFKDLETFCEKGVQHCSYDLRLGREVYLVGESAPQILSEERPYISLAPGQFAILTCHEKLRLDKSIMGFITLRNRYKMQGLINVSGFHVDPTFEEILVFAVQNVGPTDIRLKFKDPTFTIFFAEVDGNSKKEREAARTGITLQDVTNLGGNTITLAKLKEDIDRVRMQLLIYAPFAVAATAALILSLFKK